MRPASRVSMLDGSTRPPYLSGAMAKLPIIVAPDPRLKQISKPVEKVDSEIRQPMDDMLEPMYAAPGIGLAAPQVGVLKRVIVLDIADEDQQYSPLRMANTRSEEHTA